VLTDDLSAPLGQRKSRPSRKLTLAQLHLIAGVLALALVVGTGWMFLADKPFSREPTAAAHRQMPAKTSPGIDEAEIRLIRLSPGERMTVPDDKVAATPVAAPPTKTVTIIDGMSGRRQEVEIPVSADETPDPATGALPEPKRPVQPVRAAAERSRPSEVGARRSKNTSAKSGTP
jgi:hypothetical protein